MTSNIAWDEIDATLLGAMHASPSTPAELIEETGFPAEVVKDLLHAYVRGGMATRPGLIAVRYELTLLGQRRLRDLIPNQMAKAA
jgi:hypothetical protein